MADHPIPTPYTVSSLTLGLKRALEGGFSRIYLEGEISGWRVYPSGHAYFTLKDAAAQISAVMFREDFARCLAKHPGIDASLKDGAKVVVYGTVTVYGPRGQYQIVVRAAKLAGLGELYERYEALKAKLRAEGIFDDTRKRPLPRMPRRIGLVTSEAGAVLHDMCRVLTRRFPNLSIRLHPALVQGETAPRTLIAGLRYFDTLAVGDGPWKPDLVILARGGGSFEDLFCFNDEELVRTVAALRVPVISAVGHETDFTLCDFAADLRAGTPSIAAETAVPVMSEIVLALDRATARLAAALRARGAYFAQRVDQLGDQLASTLTLSASQARARLERVESRLAASLRLAAERPRTRLERAAGKLEVLSPYATLSRGYSLTTAADGSVVRDAARLKSGDVVSTRLAQGSFTSIVTPRPA